MRAYYLGDEDDGWAFIAPSLKIAKQRHQAYVAGELGIEYIEVVSKWIKEADVKGLKEGIVLDGIDALKRNIYAWAYDEVCPNCKCTSVVRYQDDVGYYCEECEDRV